MKIAVICPETFIEKLKVLEAEFHAIDFHYLIYNEYEEVEDIVKKNQRSFDCLLFSGLISYYISKDILVSDALYEILPRFEGEVMSALLQVSLKGYSVERVSFDTYSREIIREALQEVGIVKELDEIVGMKEAYDDYQNNQTIYHFHKKAYEEGRADICVTTHNEVAQLLRGDGIPCIKSERTYETIRSTIRRLEMRYLETQNTPQSIAVISLFMSEKEHQRPKINYEYLYMVDRLKVIEQVYLFAQRLEAAVVEGNNGYVYLFTTKKLLTEVTKNYTSFSIMDQLNNKIFHHFSIGIGYGSTMFQAKRNSMYAIERAEKYESNAIFLAYTPEKIIGPIGRKGDSHVNALLLEEKYEKISMDSGVSVKYLLKIKRVMETCKKNTFTSKELAEYCSLPVRNMDRIIEKLMESGYACIFGMRTQRQTGRPSRVLIFYL